MNEITQTNQKQIKESLAKPSPLSLLHFFLLSASLSREDPPELPRNFKNLSPLSPLVLPFLYYYTFIEPWGART